MRDLDCTAIPAGQRNPVAIFLRRNLADEPFAGVDAQPGAGDVLVVDHRNGRAVAQILLGQVPARIVGDLDHLFGKEIGLGFARARVLVAEFVVLCEPAENRGLVG